MNHAGYYEPLSRLFSKGFRREHNKLSSQTYRTKSPVFSVRSPIWWRFWKKNVCRIAQVDTNAHKMNSIFVSVNDTARHCLNSRKRKSTSVRSRGRCNRKEIISRIFINCPNYSYSSLTWLPFSYYYGCNSSLTDSSWEFGANQCSL